MGTSFCQFFDSICPGISTYPTDWKMEGVSSFGEEGRFVSLGQEHLLVGLYECENFPAWDFSAPFSSTQWGGQHKGPCAQQVLTASLSRWVTFFSDWNFAILPLEELCQAKLSTGKQKKKIKKKKTSRFFAVRGKSCVITYVLKSIHPSTRPSFPFKGEIKTPN